MKPKIFIGSSSERKDEAYSIQELVDDFCEPTVWDQDLFSLSKTSIQSLIDSLSKFDFAVFIFGTDDITKIRHRESKTVRDNVIFEFGLFVGKIGIERTFFVFPKGENLELPSDLLGLTGAEYNPKRSDSNLLAALGPVKNKIKKKIKELGFIEENLSFINSGLTKDKIAKSLNAYINELLQISDNFLNNIKDYVATEFQAVRWKIKTIRFIESKIGSVEAEIFSHIRTNRKSGQDVTHFISALENHIEYLEDLIIKIEKEEILINTKENENRMIISKVSFTYNP
ncbi:MAG: nucleotide-binding protein [Balneola sp.]|jgi:hypothetical protein